MFNLSLALTGTAKILIAGLALAAIARKPDKFIDEDPFFTAQTWTLKDAYMLLIPVMFLWWVVFIAFEAWERYNGVLNSLAWIMVLPVYIFFHRKVLKSYQPYVAMFGLDKEGLNRSVYMVNIAAILFVSSLWIDPGPLINNRASDMYSITFISALLSGIFVSTIGGPVVEEFLFRGILYAPVSRKLEKWKSILYVSLIDWLIHFRYSFSIHDTILPFCFFVFFSYIYQHNKSIYGPIALHIGYNSFAMVLIMKTTPLWRSHDSGMVSASLAGIGLVLLFAVNASRIVSGLKRI